MRVTVLDGTPEEIARYEQLRAEEMAVPLTQSNGVINEELLAFLRDRSETETSFQLAKRFVSAALARGDVEAIPGKSKSSDDGYNTYLRLYKRGPRRVGAAVYFTPSSRAVEPRLPKEAADGRAGVEVRNPNIDNEYNIRLRLDSDAALETALELLQEALDHMPV